MDTYASINKRITIAISQHAAFGASSLLNISVNDILGSQACQRISRLRVIEDHRKKKLWADNWA